MQAIKGVFSLLMAFFTLFPQIMAPIPAMLNEDSYFEEWSPEQEYTEDYAIVLEKDPTKEFVVLNLTDVQMTDDEYYIDGFGAQTEAMITRLVEEQKPDLITLTGDNAWSTLSYIELVNFMDSLGIPWAPVMGNHDGQGTLGEFWCAKLFDDAENCLWKFGPKDMGHGNYIINIEENGRVIHTLFMMDTHSDGTWKDENGEEVSGYDHLWDNQIAWYEWAVKGIKKLEGHTVLSTAFMHIPVYEFKEAWEASYDKENDEFTGLYGLGSYGVIHETPCPGALNNHFMDTVLELGSTKDMIFGHDHVNNASILYNGVRLTYGMKTGMACYAEEGLQGGTVLKISSLLGVCTVEHINYGAEA